MNIPRITNIIESRTEAEHIKTILFNDKGDIKSGQFYMIWIPGVDEIPMSVSYQNGDTKGFTFKKVGEATTALYSLQPGEKIGVRGPYGNSFRITGNHILFVGGGTGIAMLAPAVEDAVKKQIQSTVIIGAKTKKELLFEKRLRGCGAEVFVATDDGSKGFRGFASDLAEDILRKEPYDLVITCGPELMMKHMLSYCKDISFQASLERYMKCAIGLCGQCCIGEGIRVCHDGTIFDGKTLKNMEDFGVYRRDSAGRKIRF